VSTPSPGTVSSQLPTGSLDSSDQIGVVSVLATLFARRSKNMMANVPWRSATAVHQDFSTKNLILATDPPVAVKTAALSMADATASWHMGAMHRWSTDDCSNEVSAGNIPANRRLYLSWLILFCSHASTCSKWRRTALTKRRKTACRMQILEISILRRMF
jgi:hypothetical protein